jgi:hypothetical protein
LNREQGMAASSEAGRVGGGIWKEVPLLDGEVVAKESQAYHRAGSLHLVWGKLFLTSRRLIYCPSKLSGPWRNQRLAIPLEEITALGRTKRPWYWTLPLWGMPPDSFYVEVRGKRHLVQRGWGMEPVLAQVHRGEHRSDSAR